MSPYTVQFLRVAVFLTAVMGVYALTAYWGWRQWRPVPGRMEALFARRAVGIVLGVCSLAGAGCILYGILVEPRLLRETTHTLHTDKLPRGTRLRVVHVADLHVRRLGGREQRLIERVRTLKPDAILHTGDFFSRAPGTSDLAASILSHWDGPQFAVFGNLDHLGDFPGVMRDAGVQVLAGQMAQPWEDLPVTVTGMPMESLDRDVLNGLPETSFNIVLYHAPEGFPITWGTPADLMLAGHTHGGQVRLPFYGALVTMDPTGKRYESGRFRQGGCELIVSRGIGSEPNLPEIRFACPPELVIIDIVGTR